MIIVSGILLAMWAFVYFVIGLLDIIDYFKKQAKSQKSWFEKIGQNRDEIISEVFLISAAICMLIASNKLFYQ